MQQSVKSILITGCNRGLGKQLVHLIASKVPTMRLYITSRLPPKQLSSQLAVNNLNSYQLDINDAKAVRELAHQLASSGVKLDFIVANAAIGYDGGGHMPSHQIARDTLKTNTDSTIYYIKEFLPLLSQQGRVIVVSSEMAALGRQPKNLQVLLNNPALTEEEVLTASKNYVLAAQKKEMKGMYWSSYGTSKALVSAWGRFVLPRLLKGGQSRLCVHPGWCRTDMGGSYAPLSAATGAENLFRSLWLNQFPDDLFLSETSFVSYMDCE